MIRDFTDRRPAVSALLIAALLFLLPAPLMVLDDFVLSGRLHAAALFFYCSIAAQTVLFLKVERPVLAAEPFLLGLVGLCAGEILYAVSGSASAPGAGPDPLAYLISSYLIAVCGGNAAGAVGALILCFFLCIGRKTVEHFRYRD